jgi:hypothetical protein
MAYKNLEQHLKAKLTGEQWDEVNQRWGNKRAATWKYRNPESLCTHKDLVFFAELLNMKAYYLFRMYGVAKENLSDLQIRDLKILSAA